MQMVIKKKKANSFNTGPKPKKKKNMQVLQNNANHLYMHRFPYLVCIETDNILQTITNYSVTEVQQFMEMLGCVCDNWTYSFSKFFSSNN